MSLRMLVAVLSVSACALLITAHGYPTALAAAAEPSHITVIGSIVDASLTPIAGAVVTLERGARAAATATSDANGAFRFVNVTAGDYRVRVEHGRFSPLMRDLHLTESMTTIQLPIVLTRPQERSGPLPAAAPIAAPAPLPRGGATGPASSSATADAKAGRGGATPTGQAAERNSAVIAPGTTGLYEPHPFAPPAPPMLSGERYAHVEENRFHRTVDAPLSTFSADVDTASYTNVRRFLSAGQLPPPDAVRVEEFVNYFHFDYAEPGAGRPLGLTTEIGDCPWAPSHKLVLIGAHARSSAARAIEGRNIVLLLDVSGSMAPAERLPLIKAALGMFVDTLGSADRLAIVTYAGSSGVALPSTSLAHRETIRAAIANLSAGGSTNGGQGLITAYRVARDAFIPGGVNRVILATDGDFNVGIVSQHDLLHLIERERDSGVFLSVLGVGSGNLKDATMERLADRGNGNYAYLDSLQEARRVLVREGDATLETVAQDVKFQVEFNPTMISAWKLIGYENRALAARDFNDDRKDAGDMGAGHTVTVLYEVLPAGTRPEKIDGDDRPGVDPLRYQETAPAPMRPAGTASARTGEWLTVKARFKLPEAETSDLIAQSVRTGSRIEHLPFASAVAEFALLLRDGSGSRARWSALLSRADRLRVPASLATDKAGFAELVAIADGLSR